MEQRTDIQDEAKRTSNDINHHNKMKTVYTRDPVIFKESDFGKDFEDLEREADLQAKLIEINECLEHIAQLVDLFKHRIILPKLELNGEEHDDAKDEFKRNKGATGNHRLDALVVQTAISMGLTKEQWRQLLHLNLTAGDVLEITKVSRSHLKKVHDMASRLLEPDEKAATFSLIGAIENHLPDKYFLTK